MTDTKVKVDLDEYTAILDDLNREIAAYGSERQSLYEIAGVLRQLHETSRLASEGAEETIGYGTAILKELRDLKLPEALTGIDSRYETHQKSLTSVTDTMQQIVHEQQRSALEMLQNAQHSKQALENHAESVKAAMASHEAAQERIAQQLESLVAQNDSAKTMLAHTENKLKVLRNLVIAVILLVLAVGVAAVSI